MYYCVLRYDRICNGKIRLMTKHAIAISAIVIAPISKVWDGWNKPEHIENWAFASDDWEAFGAENDLRVGGKFKTTMSAKDKSASFDFEGVYTAVKKHELIEYDMEDKRHVKIEFTELPEGVKVVETFDLENENTEDMQRDGWQSILNNFKSYVERM